MAIKEIKQNDIILAKYISSKEFEEGLKFYSSDNDFIQLGTWKYDSGRKLLPHIHNNVERIVEWTQEIIYVKSGSVKASIYGVDEELVSEIFLKEGDILILLRGGHGYEILEDNTQVKKIKNGPYVGAEKDRRRIF